MTAPTARPGALAGARRGTCHDCRRPVWWVRLATGGTMPVDPAVDPEGTIAAYRDSSGAAVGYTLHKDEDPEPGHSRYITHFATCAVKLARAAKAAAAKAAPALPPNVARLDEYRGRATGPTGGLGLPTGRRGR